MNQGIYRLKDDLSRGEAINELATLPRRVRDLVSGLEVHVLESCPLPGEWSPIQVCKHLRDASQVYGMRFKWMVLDDDPTLPNYDEDRWVAESPDSARDIGQLLDEMAAYRAETVRLLKALPEEGWLRTGRHHALGSVILEQYVRHQVEHERRHLAQLGDSLKISS